MNLTNRQTEALKLTALGQPIKEIARNMGISPKTAEKHRQAVYEKLGVKNQVRAVVVGIRLGIVRI